MERTKNGNIKIEINPERKYQGQFVGYEHYRLADVSRAFPAVDNFSDLDEDDYDLGDGSNNREMIQHHVMPYRRVGHIVG